MLSFFLTLILLIPIAVFKFEKLPAVFADEASLYVASTSCVKTGVGVFFQSYIGLGAGETVSVSFFSADRYEVYGFESNAGGEIRNAKRYLYETSMKGADENGAFSTWTVDPESVPYQAFEVDVKGIKGNIVIGFQGNTEDGEGELIMQIYDPREGAYFDVAKRKHISGMVSFSYELDAQKYAENGRLRYRVTFPEDSSDKRIYMKNASAGKINKKVQYGTTKTKATSGNLALNCRGEFSANEYFMVEVVGEKQTVYSLPVPLLQETKVTDPQLIHFSMTFGARQTERRFSWTTATDMPTFLQVVPYGTIEPDFTDATVYKGITQHFVHDNVHGSTFEKSYEHYVTVEDFELGKEYWFRYGDGENVWSAPCYLRIDDGDDKFSFIVGGDPQPLEVKEEERQAILDRYEIMVDSVNEGVRLVGAEFVMSCGDGVEIGNLEICWDCYFESLYPIYTNMTLASTMGNHDCGGYDIWRKKHNYPDNSDGLEGGFGSFYSFDYGNVHFTVMNGNWTEYNGRKELRDRMLAWIEEDLSRTDKEFKILLTHQGMYSYPSHTNDSETVEMRPIMTAIIDKYDVDIVFQGHDHVWMRTNTMENGKKVENKKTIVDIVSGEKITYFVDPDGTTYTNPGTITASKYAGANPSGYANLISVACASQPKLPTFTTVEVENGKLVLKGWVRDADGGCSRISEYYCYGDVGDDDFAIIKSSFYEKLEKRIKALPEIVTSENTAEVAELMEICARESEVIKESLIPSYAKLAAAYDELFAIRKGDFDGDGEISVADALAALRIAAKMAVCTENDLRIGDIDADGEITVSDALAILRVAAKMSDTL